MRYQIIVVEQDDKEIFNKAQIMNSAFKYVINNTDFDCIFFHDVDLLSEDDRLLYKCRGKLEKFYSSVNYDYKLCKLH